MKRHDRSFRRTAASGLSWILLQKGSLQGVTLISTMVLARLLDPKAFGLLALTATFMTFAQQFIDQGMGAAIVQRKDLRPEHLDSVFWMNLGVSALLLIAGYSLAGPISRVFAEPGFVPVFRVLLLNLPISAINLVQRSLLQRNMEFRSLTLPTMISVAVGAVTGISMALLGMGVWSLVAQGLVTNAATIPLLWHASTWRPRMRFSMGHFREIFSFSIYVMCTTMLYVLNTQIDRLLIGFFMGTAALGVYAIAIRLVESIDSTISQVVATVFFPMLSAKQGDPAAFSRILKQSFRIVALVALPVFVGISLVAANLLPLLYGVKWIEGVPVMTMMSYLYVAYALARVNNTAITAAGHPRIILSLHVFSTLTHVVCMYFAAQVGLLCVAVAYVVRVYAFFPLYLLALQRTVKFRIRHFLEAIYPPLCGVCAMALTVLSLRWGVASWFAGPWAGLILTVAIGIASYTLGMLCFAPRWTWSMAKESVLIARTWQQRRSGASTVAAGQ